MSAKKLTALAARKQKKDSFFTEYAHWILLFPFLLLFLTLIILPIICAIGLSFTDYNGMETPDITFWDNYVRIFSKDSVFMQKILPNTIIYAVLVGPGGFILAFFMAWLLSQLNDIPRTILAVVLYLPSMTAGVTVSTVWAVIFSGDRTGYLNSLLLRLNLIQSPITWLQNETTLMPIMIIVALWSSMGIGFLSILAGIMNVDKALYEAARLDGVKNRVQEALYVTIPSIRPQLLFGAVMAVVNAFNSAGLGVQLSGSNPTPGYAGSVIVNHIDDYGFIRYEMGYAAALSVVLLLIISLASKVAHKLFGNNDD
jgi:multiple sugar transport system permease protein